MSSDADPRHSLGPVIALGLAAALAVAAVVVAIVGGDDVSATAVRVNAAEVSQKAFNDQLEQLSDTLREQGAPASVAGDASVASETAAQLAQLYVYTGVLGDRVEVSDADRSDLVAANRDELSAYSPAVRNLVVDATLVQRTLTEARGEDGADRYFARLARRADIAVDPRYGFWNAARAQVCPPTGCASAAPGS